MEEVNHWETVVYSNDNWRYLLVIQSRIITGEPLHLMIHPGWRAEGELGMEMTMTVL